MATTKTVHGKSKTAEYRTWKGMNNRCYNRNNKDFSYYGGRGIAVCVRWRNDFVAFLEDLGERPSVHHTLERINNNEGYSPTNCRWDLRLPQARNRRTSRHLTFNGERLHIMEWATRLGVSRETLKDRLGKLGWTLDRALTTPKIK